MCRVICPLPPWVRVLVLTGPSGDGGLEGSQRPIHMLLNSPPEHLHCASFVEVPDARCFWRISVLPGLARLEGRSPGGDGGGGDRMVRPGKGPTLDVSKWHLLACNIHVA